MFAEFLNIIFKSIKLDKTLYSDNKNFGEASIYFAGISMDKNRSKLLTSKKL